MKLLYTLTPPQIEALSLEQGEKLWYCVPVDLWFDNESKLAKESYTAQVWLAVTEKRFVAVAWMMTGHKDCRRSRGLVAR